MQLYMLNLKEVMAIFVAKRHSQDPQAKGGAFIRRVQNTVLVFIFHTDIY